jgi:lipid A 1-phosphatase
MFLTGTPVYDQDPEPIDHASLRISDATGVLAAVARVHLQSAAEWEETRGRFVATGLQVIIPLVLGDRVGLVQLVFVAVSTTAATHGFKWILNDVEVGPVRLGQRPNGGERNMPSGHSSMAGSALGFLWRRYGAWHLLYLLPLLLGTMAARVFFYSHTASAVVAGALLGLAMAYFMTTPRQDDRNT